MYNGRRFSSVLCLSERWYCFILGRWSRHGCTAPRELRFLFEFLRFCCRCCHSARFVIAPLVHGTHQSTAPLPCPLPTTRSASRFTAATAATFGVANIYKYPPLRTAKSPPTTQQLEHFRAALLALTLTRASAYLIQPVRAWLTALHDSVRDDRYLVGMRLQDHSDKVP